MRLNASVCHLIVRLLNHRIMVTELFSTVETIQWAKSSWRALPNNIKTVTVGGSRAGYHSHSGREMSACVSLQNGIVICHISQAMGKI